VFMTLKIDPVIRAQEQGSGSPNLRNASSVLLDGGKSQVMRTTVRRCRCIANRGALVGKRYTERRNRHGWGKEDVERKECCGLSSSDYER